MRITRTCCGLSAALAALLLATAPALAGDDPSIQGQLRTDIHASMRGFVDAQSVDGTIRVYDAVDGKLLSLKLDNIHEGIVRKGDFYVSCADFVDQGGRKIDVDFLVIPKEGELLTTQALVHSVDGKKRKYHLEK